MRHAIVMLCILNDKYVLGAIINILHQRKLLGKNNNIEFVIMVDHYIYKNNHNLLKQYFDKVHLINLFKINDGDFYKSANKGFVKKYGSWLGYSTNKWQCLNLIEYDKVLFLDIDIIPIKKEFYDIFTFNTPAIHIHSHNKINSCISNAESSTVNDTRITSFTFKQFVKKYKIEDTGSLDGGIILLKPNKKIAKEYENFTKEEFKTEGMVSFPFSSIDETSMYYFLHQIAKKQRSKIYTICSNYAYIFWDKEKMKLKEEGKGIYALNFLSFVKPWIKPITLCWKEELLWHSLFKKFKLYKNKYANFLYIKGIFQALIEIYWTEFSFKRFDETYKASVERNKEKILSNLFIRQLIKKESKYTEIPDDVMRIFNDIQKK
jgi:hypothetical protein